LKQQLCALSNELAITKNNLTITKNNLTITTERLEIMEHISLSYAVIGNRWMTDLEETSSSTLLKSLPTIEQEELQDLWNQFVLPPNAVGIPSEKVEQQNLESLVSHLCRSQNLRQNNNKYILALYSLRPDITLIHHSGSMVWDDIVMTIEVEKDLATACLHQGLGQCISYAYHVKQVQLPADLLFYWCQRGKTLL